MQLSPEINKLARSQKGDAVVMVSVLVAGMVFLVVALMMEKADRFSGTQELGKQAVENTYNAEEGLEYVIYSAKEGINRENDQDSFGLSSVRYLNDGSQEETYDTTAKTLAAAVGSLPSDNLVIISQSKKAAGAGQDDKTKRSLFTNLPKSFYNQVSVWQNTAECYSGDSGSVKPSNLCYPDTGTGGTAGEHNYQLTVPLSSLAADWSNVKCKIIFKCRDSAANGCSISNARIRRIIAPAPEGCLSGPQKCPMVNDNSNKDTFSLSDGDTPRCLSDPVSLTFDGQDRSAPHQLVFSDWFDPADYSDRLEGLGGQSLVVEFTAKDGSQGIEETVVPLLQADNGIAACKDDKDMIKGGSKMRAGIFKIIVKKNN